MTRFVTVLTIISCLFLLTCIFGATSIHQHPSEEYIATCGWSWQKEYIQHHNDILIGNNPKKLVIAVPLKSGLADNIHGYLSAFLVALITDRAFLIQTVPPFHDDKILRTMAYGYSSPFINWTSPIFDRERYQCLLRPHYEDSKKCIGEPSLGSDSMYDENINYMKIDDIIHTFTTVNGIGMTNDIFFNKAYLAAKNTKNDVVYTASNRGFTYKIFQNTGHRKILEAKYNLTQLTAFPCLFNFLFQPLPEVCPRNSGCAKVTDRLKHIDKDPFSLAIAVHIRRPAGYIQHAQCVNSLLHYYRAHGFKVHILLITTDANLQRMIHDIYGHKLMLATGNISQVEVADERHVVSAVTDRQGVLDAARDFYVMSLAKIHVLSPKSGFGVVGAMSRLTGAHIMYKMTEGAFEPRDCSKALQGDPLSFFANEWSGL